MADEALFAAKRDGRDRAVAAWQGTPPALAGSAAGIAQGVHARLARRASAPGQRRSRASQVNPQAQATGRTRMAGRASDIDGRTRGCRPRRSPAAAPAGPGHAASGRRRRSPGASWGDGLLRRHPDHLREPRPLYRDLRVPGKDHRDGPDQEPACHGHPGASRQSTFTARRRSALPMTLTDDRAIAAAATTGDNNNPKNG